MPAPIRTLTRTQLVPRPLDEAFAFFADPWNLEAITPPWLRFAIVSAPAELAQGSLLRYRLRLLGVPLGWLTEIAEWAPPRSFTDVQLAGPYALWEHTHRLVARPGATEVHDHVRYRLPGGRAGDALAAPLVRRFIDGIFAYRRERLRELLG